MSYIVLARKWRPAQFADIVGQGHVVRTLMNACRAERIHHAYLFTGSRGIGKTSIARIFAKALRCQNVTSDEYGIRSCGECASCREIAAGSSVDVIEIDGASNNGVDAVREIRDNAKYLPAAGSRKIYIIDEVHMLTTAAFNALLKTLEEPPAHVIFVFATTEPHKIPATILSRCQRFDFRRVTPIQIQNRLKEILSAEGVQIEAGVLPLIARAAEGSMRDALSLLDQIIAFSGTSITVQSVRDSIGLIESQTLLSILSGVLSRKPLEALTWVDKAYQQGHDLRVLTRSLIEYLHGVILAKVGAAGSHALEIGPNAGKESENDEWKEIVALAELRPLEELEMIFQAIHHGIEWVARSPQPKVVLDVLLIKCATAEALAFAENIGAQQAPGDASGGKNSAPSIRTTAPAGHSVQTVPQAATTPVAAPVVSASRAFAWEPFVDHVRTSRPLLASVLEHGSCAGEPDAESTVTLCYRPSEAYYRDQLQARTYNEQLIALAKEYFGRSLRFKFEVKDAAESIAARKEREHQEKEQTAREAARNHPILKEAKALFGGEFGPIQISGAEA